MVIPSMGRPKKVLTSRLQPDALVCVPKSQAKEYGGIGDLLIHPDAVKGLSAKRNWILDKFSNEDFVIMLDDDLVSLRKLFCAPGETDQNEKCPRYISDVLQNCAQMGKEAGCYLFGFEPSESSCLHYSGHKPFGLTGLVNGSALGFICGHKLRFDERIVAKEDYDISLLNAHKHRKCFRDLRYAFAQKDTFHNPGGQCAFRNSITEEADFKILQRKYGNAILRKQLGGTRKTKYAGICKVVLNLPF